MYVYIHLSLSIYIYMYIHTCIYIEGETEREREHRAWCNWHRVQINANPRSTASHCSTHPWSGWRNANCAQDQAWHKSIAWCCRVCSDTVQCTMLPEPSHGIMSVSAILPAIAWWYSWLHETTIITTHASRSIVLGDITQHTFRYRSTQMCPSTPLAYLSLARRLRGCRCFVVVRCVSHMVRRCGF